MSISKEKILPLDYLRECLSYCPESGVLTWKPRPPSHFPDGNDGVFNKRFSNRRAGSVLRDHLAVQIMGAKHYAHRLCWALHYGRYPVGSIDHINGDGFDNRISNLREVTHRSNTHNQKTRSTNKSGCMGVSLRPDTGKYRARINTPAGREHLGDFNSLEEAISARKEAEIKYGYHENHGR